MSNTTVAYYKLKPSPYNSPKARSLAQQQPIRGAGRSFCAEPSSGSARTIIARLLFTALILLLTGLRQSPGATRGQPRPHIVQPGETLWLIAQSYGVDVGNLASTNGISDARHILSWQELTIPAGASPRAARRCNGRDPCRSPRRDPGQHRRGLRPATDRAAASQQYLDPVHLRRAGT